MKINTNTTKKTMILEMENEEEIKILHNIMSVCIDVHTRTLTLQDTNNLLKQNKDAYQQQIDNTEKELETAKYIRDNTHLGGLFHRLAKKLNSIDD